MAACEISPKSVNSQVGHSFSLSFYAFQSTQMKWIHFKSRSLVYTPIGGAADLYIPRIQAIGEASLKQEKYYGGSKYGARAPYREFQSFGFQLLFSLGE